MNYVLAHIKGHAHKKTFKLLSDTTLFDTHGDNASYVPYAPDHNLDSDSWFMVEEFKSKSFCLPLLTDESTSADFDNLEKVKFADINYLCAVQGENYYFQKVTPSLFVNRKTIAFGDVASVAESKNQLVIKDEPDAIYLTATDQLIFKKLSSITSIFRGMDLLFKEATNEQVNEFLTQSFVSLGNGYDLNKVSKPNRQRIGLALATLSEMADEDKGEMLAYIHDYSDNTLTYDSSSEQFEISSDNELKTLLYGVEERFYTTPRGHERRLANSVQKID